MEEGAHASPERRSTIRATLHMRVRAGNERLFEQAWREAAVAIGKTPGNLGQALLRDSSDPASYAIASDWDSPEAFRRFQVSGERDVLTASLRALRESARMEVHEIISHIE